MARKKKNQENSAPIEYIDEVLEKGIKALEENILRKNMMNQTAKDTAEITGVSKSELIKMKDYIYYRGKGWGNDAIDKEEVDKESGETREKHPDKVSPTFRNLCQIVDIMYKCGKPELLDVYFAAAKNRGVNIDIDETKFNNPEAGEKIAINTALEIMSPLQTCICENNDYINDTLAPAAENQNVTPKSKFKKIVNMKHRIENGKDLRDQIQDELLENIMYGDSLERLRDLGKPKEEQNE